MSFNATNHSVIIVLLMALTLFTAGVRMQKPVDHNWPLIYWIIMMLVSFRYPDETFDPRIILIGAGVGLLLRFEFLGRIVVNFLRFVEVCVWAYIIYMGFVMVST